MCLTQPKTNNLFWLEQYNPCMFCMVNIKLKYNSVETSSQIRGWKERTVQNTILIFLAVLKHFQLRTQETMFNRLKM